MDDPAAGATETTRTGTFRAFRIVPAVHHINLFDVDAGRLYTVHQVGYPDGLQATVDDLRTGDLVDATLAGDPEAPEEAWRLTRAAPDPERSVAVDFAVDLDPAALPAPVADDPDRRERAATEPVGTVLEHEGLPVGEVWCQPRDPLPDGAFAPNVLGGLLPLETLLSELPEVGEPPAELLVLDTAAPDDRTFEVPFGVFVALTGAGDPVGDDLRERYGLPLDRTADTRPAFDPYG
jgi:hypothetical protein